MEVLRYSSEQGLLTKTGIMVGLGETSEEVMNTMKQVLTLALLFTIGQYLRPTKDHLEVKSYVSNDKFDYYKKLGLQIGFDIVESGPLVRSSYHADEQARLAIR